MNGTCALRLLFKTITAQQDDSPGHYLREASKMRAASDWGNVVLDRKASRHINIHVHCTHNVHAHIMYTRTSINRSKACLKIGGSLTQGIWPLNFKLASYTFAHSVAYVHWEGRHIATMIQRVQPTWAPNGLALLPILYSCVFFCLYYELMWRHTRVYSQYVRSASTCMIICSDSLTCCFSELHKLLSHTEESWLDNWHKK